MAKKPALPTLSTLAAPKPKTPMKSRLQNLGKFAHAPKKGTR